MHTVATPSPKRCSSSLANTTLHPFRLHFVPGGTCASKSSSSSKSGAIARGFDPAIDDEVGSADDSLCVLKSSWPSPVIVGSCNATEDDRGFSGLGASGVCLPVAHPYSHRSSFIGKILRLRALLTLIFINSSKSSSGLFTSEQHDHDFKPS